MKAQEKAYRTLVAAYRTETNKAARKALASKIYWAALDLVNMTQGIDRAAYVQAVAAYQREAGY